MMTINGHGQLLLLESEQTQQQPIWLQYTKYQNSKCQVLKFLVPVFYRISEPGISVFK